MDATHGDSGALFVGLCGATGSLDSARSKAFIDFLHLRSQGKVKSSLTVHISDQNGSLPGADVVLEGSGGNLTKKSDSKGSAIFDGIPPCNYKVSASLRHYVVESQAGYNTELNLLIGGCENSYIELKAVSTVSRVVRKQDGSPKAHLDLDLSDAEFKLGKERALARRRFGATTDADGKFQFEGVSPGKYLLGVDISGHYPASVPTTYYPGQRTEAGAIPIEVNLGGSVENVDFNLPDFGTDRALNVCVFDAHGRPLMGAYIRDSWRDMSPNSATIGKELKTPESGCVKVTGVAAALYEVYGYYIKPGGNGRDARSTELTVIQPGNKPVCLVLVLSEP